MAPVLYADDTCLIISAETLATLQKSLNQEVEKARQWMVANKLTINTAKSNALVISYASNTSPENVTISCGGLSFATQTNVKYLGLIIDYKLSLESHIKYVERKIACALAWGFTYKCSLQRLTTLLNRIMRIISSAKNSDSLNPSYQELNFLKIQQNFPVKSSKNHASNFYGRRTLQLK